MIDQATVEAYVRAAVRRDEPAVRTLTQEVMAAGANPVEVADQLIAPAQRMIGELWEIGDISVADEHASTSISQRVAADVVRHVSLDEKLRCRVLAIPAPGEWHRLSVDILAGALTAVGAEVITPPPAVTAGQLIPTIHDDGPEVAVVSCAMPANLSRVYAVAAIAREAQLPVVVGGGAFAAAPERATNLGLDLMESVGTTLEWLKAGKAAVPSPVPAEVAARVTAVRGSFPGLCDRVGAAVRTAPVQSGDPVADGLWVVRAFASAVACDDPSILAQHLRWQQRRHHVAGVISAERLAHELGTAVQEMLPELVGVVQDAWPKT